MTSHSDQFFWRVRAVDLAGQATPWAESGSTGSRASGWTSLRHVYPTGDVKTAPGRRHHEYQAVLPVDAGAARDDYELVGLGRQELLRWRRQVQDGQHDVHPRNASDCGVISERDVYWKVRSRSTSPYPVGDGLPGIASDTRGSDVRADVGAPWGSPWNDNARARRPQDRARRHRRVGGGGARRPCAE